MFKKVFIITVLFISISTLSSAESQDKLKTVAILFSASSEIDDALFEILAEHFTIQITTSNKNYMIISRDYLNKVLNDLNFKKRDTFNDNAAKQIGKVVEAELVINCSVTMTRNSYSVSVRGLDVGSGQTLFSENKQTKNIKELDKIVEQVASVSKTDADKEREEKEKLEKERLEKEKLAKELEEKARLEKEKLEKERLAKEKEEKDKLLKEKLEKETEENNQLIETTEKSKFTKIEENFIDKFYKGAWGFSVDDRRLSLLRYKQSLGAGIGLAASGGTIFLGGLIATIVTLVYYEDNDVYVGDPYNNTPDGYYRDVETQRTTYQKTAAILGGTIMPLGATICILSAIPFWFSYMIATIYKKTTGEKLAFFERVNFNAEWRVENGKWKMENGEWKMKNKKIKFLLINCSKNYINKTINKIANENICFRNFLCKL